jgi:hypothetical protein
MEIFKQEITDISAQTRQLDYYRAKNKIKDAYYEGKNRLKNPKISLSPHYKNMLAPVSWPENVVERKNERINLIGFTAPPEVELEDIFNDNEIEDKSKQAHRAALLYGVSYAIAGHGKVEDGEPEVLITVESPNNTIGTTNPRTNRLMNLLQVAYGTFGEPDMGVYTTPNRTITFKYDNASDAYSFGLAEEEDYKLTPIEVDEHELGYVPAVMFVNRPRAGVIGGQSEITPVIIGHTDQAVLTFVEVAMARELYATPQRYFFGLPLETFIGPDGKQKSRWEAYMETVMATGPIKKGSAQAGTDTHAPLVGQFDASSPAPLLETIRAAAEQISAASGIPLSQLGYTTTNPASAEAINAQAEILIKSAEDRMDSFGSKWVQLIQYALRLKNDGVLPEGANKIHCDWRSAASTSRAADGDYVSKLIDKGVLAPDSEVTWKRLGFSEAEKQLLRDEKAARLTDSQV